MAHEGHSPWCGNLSPITGECFIGCGGFCRVPREDRERELEAHRESLAFERRLISSAALAIELIGDDELERFARESADRKASPAL